MFGMRRRDFITLLGGAGLLLAAKARRARAQQPVMPVIGFLNYGSVETTTERVAAFREGLKDAGYVEGRNVAIEFRWAEGQYNRLPALARDLVHRQVNVIVAAATVTALAAKAATSTIPIVFVGVGSDPVKIGLVASLNRPDNNVTGISILSVPLAVKRLEMLSEMVPAATTFGFLTNPKNPNSEVTLREMPTAAAALGRNLLVVKASDDADLEVAFSTLIAQRVGALLVDADPFFFTSRDRLVALALHHDLPASYEYRDYVLLGGLMSYAADASNTYHQAGIYTGKVLSGEKPADLPVTQPTKYQLVINLKTAKTLGLAIPQTLLVAADEVIE